MQVRAFAFCAGDQHSALHLQLRRRCQASAVAQVPGNLDFCPDLATKKTLRLHI
jgi:hypothetical protein